MYSMTEAAIADRPKGTSEELAWQAYMAAAITGQIARYRFGDIKEPSALMEGCAEIADAALAEHRKRFGTGQPAKPELPGLTVTVPWTWTQEYARKAVQEMFEALRRGGS